MLQEKNILKYCITYTTVSWFFFLFTLVDLLNYSTMTFINYTCIYIYIDLYVFACAHHGLTFLCLANETVEITNGLRCIDYMQ